MTSVFFGMKELLFISIYDGEKYYTDKFSMEEAKNFDNNKRFTLLSQGYDVETYEKLFYELKEDILLKIDLPKIFGSELKLRKNTYRRKKILLKNILMWNGNHK